MLIDASMNAFYYARYTKFIAWYVANTAEGPVEKHHILPRSMGGSNEADNLVALPPRAHFLAHWMLWKAYNNGKMALAFWMMACCNGMRINSKSYAAVRADAVKTIAETRKGKTTSDRQKRIASEKMRGRVVSDEEKEKISAANKGKKRSLEHREAQSKRMKGTKLSLATREKMSAAHKGRSPSEEHRIKLSISNKEYRKSLPADYVDPKKGRPTKYLWITNGVDSRQHLKTESIPDGWNRGRAMPWLNPAPTV